MYHNRQQKIQTFAYVFAMLLLFASFLITVKMQADQRRAVDRNYRTGLVNQTYLRSIDCKSSVSPTQRTPEYVKECYNQAEKATSVTVERYGHGK